MNYCPKCGEWKFTDNHPKCGYVIRGDEEE